MCQGGVLCASRLSVEAAQHTSIKIESDCPMIDYSAVLRYAESLFIDIGIYVETNKIRKASV